MTEPERQKLKRQIFPAEDAACETILGRFTPDFKVRTFGSSRLFAFAVP